MIARKYLQHYLDEQCEIKIETVLSQQILFPDLKGFDLSLYQQFEASYVMKGKDTSKSNSRSW